MAGLDQALTFFVGEGGICPPLADLGGGEEVVGTRWSKLLATGRRAARELERAWQILTREAKEISDYLGEDVTGDPCGGCRRRIYGWQYKKASCQPAVWRT